MNDAATSVPAAPDHPPPEALPHARRNFVVMVAHMALQRTGWIFKLESVMIPAFISSFTGSTWALASLPVLSRIGRRVPTLLGGRLAYGRPRLRGLLILWMGGFALMWGAIAGTLWLLPPGRNSRFLGMFLVVYALGFLFIGACNVTRGALVGRVVTIRRRGLYVGISSLLGGLTAIGSGLIINRFLERDHPLEPGHFAPLFTCAAVFFGLATLAAFLIKEDPPQAARVGDGEETDGAAGVPVHGRVFWRRVVEVLKTDRNFRRLIIAVLLLQAHGYIFPFYVPMGRDAGVISDRHLGYLVMAQNCSLAVSTLLMGMLADRGGHKRVLIICFAVTMCVPVYAVVASRFPPSIGRYAYLLVFVMIGFGPSLQRFLANYVLEISTTADHPVYLSAFATLQLATVVYAPIVGVIASHLSPEYAMLAAAGVMAVGLLMALRLIEPRQHALMTPAEPPPVTAGDGDL